MKNLKKKNLIIKAENSRIVLKSKLLRKIWRKIQIMTFIMKVLGWKVYILASTANLSLETISVQRSYKKALQNAS